MIVGLPSAGGREWWVLGSRAFAGAFETEGLEGCWGDSGANRRFVELAPQHVRRRAREPGTHHSRPGLARSPTPNPLKLELELELFLFLLSEEEQDQGQFEFELKLKGEDRTLWCEYEQLLGKSMLGNRSSKQGRKKMISGLPSAGGREWWVPGSRAFGGAFETEGLEGCWGDRGANRRFAERAPQHVRRRAREPGTHHSRPGLTRFPATEV